MNFEIVKGKYCGFCSGVTRAITMAAEASARGKVYTLGPIIHNPQVVEKLEKNNIIQISDFDDLEAPGTVLIRSHGITAEKESELRARGLDIIDATCPKVKRAHRICEDLAVDYSTVYIVGIKSHPEVIGILSRASNKGKVISSLEELDDIGDIEDAGVLAQTTFRKSRFFEIVGELLKKAKVLKMHNTICEETVNRQEELYGLTESLDLLLIVGGKNSSNTKRLYEIGREKLETYHIEIPDEIKYKWLKGKVKIGIMTGASTPLELVGEVEERINLLKSKNL
ncbi:MAG: 4-hydroxy-3-methylbut-2-enyl diphosphate reductase [Elusimicrobiota bacterium]